MGLAYSLRNLLQKIWNHKDESMQIMHKLFFSTKKMAEGAKQECTLSPIWITQ